MRYRIIRSFTEKRNEYYFGEKKRHWWKSWERIGTYPYKCWETPELVLKEISAEKDFDRQPKWVVVWRTSL
jgi:hypothetical protein